MDRINKFIALKPTKKTRYVKYKGKDTLIFKEDVQKLKSYKRNLCLDKNLNLFTKNVTTWSRKQSTGYHEKRELDQAKIAILKSKKIQKILSVVKKPNVIRNPIVDLWKNEDTVTGDIKILRSTLPKKAYAGMLKDQSFKTDNFSKLVDNIEKKYFSAPPKPIDLNKLLPKLPKKQDIKNYPQEIGLRYVIYETSNAISVFENRIAVAAHNQVNVYEFKNMYEILRIDVGSMVTNALLSRENIAYISTNKLYIKYIDGFYGKKMDLDDLRYNLFGLKPDSDNVSNNIIAPRRRKMLSKKSIANLEKNKLLKELCGVECDKSLQIKSAHPKIQLVEFDRNERSYEISHTNKIKNFSISENERYVVTNTRNNVYLHDLKKLKTTKPLKLEMQQPLSSKIHKNKLYVATTNKLIIADLSKKNIEKEKSISLQYIQSFSISKKFIVIANNDTRVTIFGNKGILSHIEQDSYIREVSAHPTLPFFVVALKDVMKLFYAKITDFDQFETCLLKSWSGSFSSVSFDKNLPWIYAMLGHEVVVFT